MDENPENIMPPPSTDGFLFCVWEAVGGNPDLYKQVKAGTIPCPIVNTCPTCAMHLAVLKQRETSAVWASLTRAQQRRVKVKAQVVLFEAEQRLGAQVVGPVVKTWLENEVGNLLGVKMQKLFPQVTEPAPPPPHSAPDPAPGKVVTKQMRLF